MALCVAVASATVEKVGSAGVCTPWQLNFKHTLSNDLVFHITLGNIITVTLLHIEGACCDTVICNFYLGLHLTFCYSVQNCSFQSRHGGRCFCSHEVSHTINIQTSTFSLCRWSENWLQKRIFIKTNFEHLYTTTVRLLCCHHKL